MKIQIHHLLLALATTATLMSGSVQAADKLPVTASFSILGDLLRVVGGERVAVSTLVGPDEDAHVFEPKPSDAKTVLQSKLLVINGLGFEPWAHKLARSAGYQGALLVATQGVPARGTDPHAWQNPLNVVVYVQNMAAALNQLDPQGAATYQRNRDAYVKDLLALDAWAKEQFATLPADKRKVITSHDAFGYFAAQYHIQFLAPQGVSTDAEPSAKGVAQLIRQIQRKKIKAVFVENMGNPKLLTQLSRDAGVTLGGSLYADALSGTDPAGATYLRMVRHNVTQLVLGMQRN